jgi:hypothetical protein
LFRILVFVLPFLHCIVLETRSWHLSSYEKYIMPSISANGYSICMMSNDDFKSFIEISSCFDHSVNHRLCVVISRFWLDKCIWSECFTCRGVYCIISVQVLVYFSSNYSLLRNRNFKVSHTSSYILSCSPSLLLEKTCLSLEINWNQSYLEVCERRWWFDSVLITKTKGHLWLFAERQL